MGASGAGEARTTVVSPVERSRRGESEEDLES